MNGFKSHNGNCTGHYDYHLSTTDEDKFKLPNKVTSSVVSPTLFECGYLSLILKYLLPLRLSLNLFSAKRTIRQKVLDLNMMVKLISYVTLSKCFTTQNKIRITWSVVWDLFASLSNFKTVSKTPLQTP